MGAKARRKWRRKVRNSLPVVFRKRCGKLSVFTMRALYMMCLLWVAAQISAAADFEIQSLDRTGRVTWSGAFTAGVVTVQAKSSLLSSWPAPATNYFTSNSVGSAQVALSPTQTFVRLLSVDISTNTPLHFTNMVHSYGILETIAGRGQFNGDKVNYWQATNEGGYATNANLSRPHIAFADPRNDDVLIVDEGSHSVLRVTPDGRVYTFAGTHFQGNGVGPGPATNLSLNWPNGGWMRSDGTFYILDTYNGKIRRVDTNGIMTTIVDTGATLGDGRALWVKSDESLIYFGSGVDATNLNRWTATGGVRVVRSDFRNLGNIVGDERTGELYVTDRGAHRVYRMNTNNVLTPIAGTGSPSGPNQGPALQVSLNEPRTICFVPNGGYFIGEHQGNRIFYVDPAGFARIWLSGDAAATGRRGDGQWFYNNPSSPKVTKVRSVTMDRHGNLIIMESNYGYVRRIRFQRLTP